MEDMNIIRQLYFGNHLNDSELERGIYILEQLQNEIKTRIKK